MWFWEPFSRKVNLLLGRFFTAERSGEKVVWQIASKEVPDFVSIQNSGTSCANHWATCFGFQKFLTAGKTTVWVSANLRKWIQKTYLMFHNTLSARASRTLPRAGAHHTWAPRQPTGRRAVAGARTPGLPPSPLRPARRVVGRARTSRRPGGRGRCGVRGCRARRGPNFSGGRMIFEENCRFGLLQDNAILVFCIFLPQVEPRFCISFCIVCTTPGNGV